MTDTKPADLTVIIPTRDRWPILQQTLEALRHQTAHGFATIVVVDGTDQAPPPLDHVRIVVKEHGGPGAARNTGVAAADTPLVLFLGDDMIPTAGLVETHLDVHARHPESESAVLGRAVWHPSVASSPVARWLEWSNFQFDYPNITGEEAGWGRFYSSNVSLKREFFLRAEGFDEDFTYDYEDLDLGWRLHQSGLRLWFERGAEAQHLHSYEWGDVVRRWESHARAERLMETKHAWFTPFFAGAIKGAVARPRSSRIWPWIEPRIPRRITPLRDIARDRTSRFYLQRLAPRFLATWEGEADLADLMSYLGDSFELAHLQSYADAVEREREAAPDEDAFYRTSRMYLYDLTAFAMSGTKRPYLSDLRHFAAPPARLLDYGCGIGADGLRLLGEGYRVEFADFANPSTEYLRWRLAHRLATAPTYDLDCDEIPGGFEVAYSLDVIEHVDDPFAFLAELEQRAAIVMVNLLEPDPDDTHLHHPLPIAALLDHMRRLGILRYRRYYDRSHLVVYRTKRPGVRGRARSVLQHRLGTRLRGSI